MAIRNQAKNFEVSEAGIAELALMSTVTSDPKSPETYKEAMESNDKENWILGIKKEFKNIKEKQVWKKISRTEMENGKQPLGTKWVFKLKDNGTYRARLVVKGYNQIPGVDFTGSHSPVATDVTICTFLIAAIIFGWNIEQFDVCWDIYRSKKACEENFYLSLVIAYDS